VAKPKQFRTHIVCLAASKGGVGKSTLTAALAVRAAQDFERVALFDGDPQLSLASWWDRRGGPKNPQLFDGDSSALAINMVAADGWDWMFLDTPPSQLDRISAIIACSDFVFIPTRPGIMDLEAVRITEEVCHEYRRPYAFILNMVAPGTKVTEAAAAHLRTNRRMLVEPFISYRPSHSNAMFSGKSAWETRDQVAKREIDALWKTVQETVEKYGRVPE